MFGLENFKASPIGLRIGELLNDPRVVADMIAVTRHTKRTPAVQVFEQELKGLDLDLTKQDKTSIGRWIREVMEQKGWTTDASSKARVYPGNIFSTGAVYYPKDETIRRR